MPAKKGVFSPDMNVFGDSSLFRVRSSKSRLYGNEDSDDAFPELNSSLKKKEEQSLKQSTSADPGDSWDEIEEDVKSFQETPRVSSNRSSARAKSRKSLVISSDSEDEEEKKKKKKKALQLRKKLAEEEEGYKEMADIIKHSQRREALGMNTPQSRGRVQDVQNTPVQRRIRFGIDADEAKDKKTTKDGRVGRVRFNGKKQGNREQENNGGKLITAAVKSSMKKAIGGTPSNTNNPAHHKASSVASKKRPHFREHEFDLDVYQRIKRDQLRPFVNTPAVAIRPGCSRLSEPPLDQIETKRDVICREAEDAQSQEFVSTRRNRRSFSASYRPNVPRSRLILDDSFYLNMGKLKAELENELVSIDSIKQPYSNVEIQRRVAAMSSYQFKSWRDIREERRTLLNEAVVQRQLSKYDDVLARSELILLNGHLVDESNVRDNAPPSTISRIEKFPNTLTVQDPNLYYPGIEKRFRDDLEFNSKELGRKYGKEMLYENTENFISSINKDTVDPRTNKPRVTIPSTRTPRSSPERQVEVAERWRDRGYKVPFPTKDHPEVVKANNEALVDQNEERFEKLHDRLSYKLLKYFNKERKELKLAPINLTTVKKQKQIENSWEMAHSKYNKKMAKEGKAVVSLEFYQKMETRTVQEAKAVTDIEGHALPPKTKYVNLDNADFVDPGRMYSEVPSWYLRVPVPNFITPVMMNKMALDYTMENLAHKEEDFLAKMMLLFGSDHKTVRQPLLARLGLHRWEAEVNEKNAEVGKPLVSFFARQPPGTICKKEFDRDYGVCPKENLRADYYYHPVVVIDPNRRDGSFMRISTQRYKDPLFPGQVRVCFPDIEKGAGGDFDYLVGRVFELNENNDDREYLSVKEYHPLHNRYTQNMERTYSCTLNPRSLVNNWLELIPRGMEEQKQLLLGYGREARHKIFNLMPTDPEEFLIWFEALKLTWLKRRNNSPFWISPGDSIRREAQITAHPELLKKLLALRKKRAAVERAKAPKTPRGSQSVPRPRLQKAPQTAKRASAGTMTVARAHAATTQDGQSTPLSAGLLRTKLNKLQTPRGEMVEINQASLNDAYWNWNLETPITEARKPTLPKKEDYEPSVSKKRGREEEPLPPREKHGRGAKRAKMCYGESEDE